jgi:hypothetical protein
MAEERIHVAIVDDNAGDVGKEARRVLSDTRWSVKVFRHRIERSHVDAIIVGSTAEVTVFDVKRTTERIREARGTLPSTPVVFAAYSFSPTVLRDVIEAGAVSCVTWDTLPTTLENLATCSRSHAWHGAAKDTFTVVEPAHDPRSGRLDAKRIAALFDVPLNDIARAVGVTVSAVSKRATAPSAQNGLRELEFVWGTLMNVFGSEAKGRAWLHAPRPDLGGQSPLSLVTQGAAKDLANYIRRALAGEPA